MSVPERLEPKRSDTESSNEPPLGPCSFSRSKFRSRPRLFPALKPCRRPPVGLPRASETNVNVGVTPRSSSQLRTPYQSPNRCWRGRTNWNGVSAKARVPEGALETSWAPAAAAPPRSARIATGTHFREITTSVSQTWSDCVRAAFADVASSTSKDAVWVTARASLAQLVCAAILYSFASSTILSTLRHQDPA